MAYRHHRIAEEADSRLSAELGAALVAASAPDGLFVCAADWEISFCNEAAAQYLGVPRDWATREQLWTLQPELLGTISELRYRSAMAAREPAEFVVPAVARHPELDEWLEIRAVPLAGAMAFFLRDVTARERGERRLRESEKSLREMNETLSVAHKAARAATWEWRQGQDVRWMDADAACALFGRPTIAAGGSPIKHWRELALEEDQPALEAALRRLFELDENTVEYRIPLPDGELRWLSANALVVEREPSGSPRRVIGITRDVTAQKETEAALRQEVAQRARAQANQQLLINELNHRVKNTLATVQSIARQTLKNRRADGLEQFNSRLMALAWAHDVLTEERWEGANLADVVARIVTPHDVAEGGRFDIAGPPVRLRPQLALAIAMGLHELVTNALKYGALAAEAGRVAVSWTLDNADDGVCSLILTWRETGGPPVAAPARKGFGSRLIEKGLAAELRGGARIEYPPEGVVCEMRARV